MNIWPETFAKDVRQRMDRYYDTMPEEFYVLSTLTVVTPYNCRSWPAHSQAPHADPTGVSTRMCTLASD